ncbi:hypothetical protein LXL04_020635 [Taraxacum kok-saghyz]
MGLCQQAPILTKLSEMKVEFDPISQHHDSSMKRARVITSSIGHVESEKLVGIQAREKEVPIRLKVGLEARAAIPSSIWVKMLRLAYTLASKARSDFLSRHTRRIKKAIIRQSMGMEPSHTYSVRDRPPQLCIDRKAGRHSPQPREWLRPVCLSKSLIATLLWDQTDSPPLELALLSLGSVPPVKTWNRDKEMGLCQQAPILTKLSEMKVEFDPISQHHDSSMKRARVITSSIGHVESEKLVGIQAREKEVPIRLKVGLEARAAIPSSIWVKMLRLAYTLASKARSDFLSRHTRRIKKAIIRQSMGMEPSHTYSVRDRPPQLCIDRKAGRHSPQPREWLRPVCLSKSLIATLLWDQTDSPPLELALLSLGSLPPVFFQP